MHAALPGRAIVAPVATFIAPCAVTLHAVGPVIAADASPSAPQPQVHDLAEILATEVRVISDPSGRSAA